MKAERHLVHSLATGSIVYLVAIIVLLALPLMEGGHADASPAATVGDRPGLTAGSGSIGSQGTAHLFAATNGRGTVKQSNARGVLRSQFVQINWQAFFGSRGEPSNSVVLDLFDGQSFVAVRDSLGGSGAGFVTWEGHLQGTDYGSVALTAGRGVMVGDIDAPSGRYHVAYAGDGVHVLQQLDPKFGPGPGDAVSPGVQSQKDRRGSDSTQHDGERQASGQVQPGKQPQTNPSIIDVMIVWTPAAREQAGGQDAILAQAYSDIERANQAYIKSRINQRLHLVYTAETNYTESGNLMQDLVRLFNGSDGYMDEVPQLRDTYGADIVSLLCIPSGTEDGRGFQMTSPSTQFADYAYNAEDFNRSDTFVHEVGHNMGAAHDRAQAQNEGCLPQCGAYPYSFGYVGQTNENPPEGFIDIMAYASTCIEPCNYINQFSDPQLFFRGAPTGVDPAQPNSADNALTLRNTAPIVAAFRNSVTMPPACSTTGSIGTGDPSYSNPLDITGLPTSCSSGKPCPGRFSDPNPYHYDVHTYHNDTGSPQCVTVTVDASACGDKVLYSSAYAGQFDPNNPCSTYLADSGVGTSGISSYSFEVAGNQTFVVEVEEGSPGAGCASYVLSVTGSGISGSDCSSPPPSSCDFPDVPAGSTFYPYVHCLACRGIISGYANGTFGPNNPVTRGQLSKIVSNAAGYAENYSTATFNDVQVGSTYFLYVERLVSRGYISGYACGGAGEPCPGVYFRPGANVTRGQTCKIVATARGLPAPPAGQQTFQDVPPTGAGSTFWTWIEALASSGAISGYACGSPEPCVPPANRPYFRPAAEVTRGQSAKIVSTAFFPTCSGSSTLTVKEGAGSNSSQSP